jgi:hypothetical protein
VLSEGVVLDDDEAAGVEVVAGTGPACLATSALNCGGEAPLSWIAYQLRPSLRYRNPPRQPLYPL